MRHRMKKNCVLIYLVFLPRHRCCRAFSFLLRLPTEGIMSTSLSTSSQSQSRDQILYSFHNITRLNIEDCIQYLDQYDWKLQIILDDFCHGKIFKKKDTPKTNQETDKNGYQRTPASNPNLGNSYTKNDGRQQPVIDSDRYYAQLLEKYGDADESARKHRRERQDYQRYSEHHPEENGKNEHIYHEKQEFLRCGIHSLNNLFQIPHLFTHEHLDNIVREFAGERRGNDYGELWIGNYDLRVLIEAINRIGYPVRQINFYNGELLKDLPWDSYFGLLINLNGAHWFTIKNLNGLYYNLDSTFSKPVTIGQKDALVAYLIHLIQKFKSIYLFTVLPQTNRPTK